MQSNIFIYFWCFFPVSCFSDPILEKAEQLESALAEKNKSSTKVKKSVPQVAPPVKPPQSAPNGALDKEIKERPPQEDRITIQGKLRVEKWKGGVIRINVFDGDQKDLGAERPKVLAVEKVKQPGSYSISVPRSDKSIWIDAYADENKDGKPGPEEPAAWYTGNPVAGNADHQSIDLKLKKPEHEPR